MEPSRTPPARPTDVSIALYNYYFSFVYIGLNLIFYIIIVCTACDKRKLAGKNFSRFLTALCALGESNVSWIDASPFYLGKRISYLIRSSVYNGM